MGGPLGSAAGENVGMKSERRRATAFAQLVIGFLFILERGFNACSRLPPQARSYRTRSNADFAGRKSDASLSEASYSDAAADFCPIFSFS